MRCRIGMMFEILHTKSMHADGGCSTLPELIKQVLQNGGFSTIFANFAAHPVEMISFQIAIFISQYKSGFECWRIFICNTNFNEMAKSFAQLHDSRTLIQQIVRIMQKNADCARRCTSQELPEQVMCGSRAKIAFFQRFFMKPESMLCVADQLR